MKSHVTYPIKVKSKEDYEDETRMPKMAKSKIWLVTITMPRDLIDEIQQGSVELEGEELDMEEVEAAYQEGEDEDELQGGEGNEGTDEQNPNEEELSL